MGCDAMRCDAMQCMYVCMHACIFNVICQVTVSDGEEDQAVPSAQMNLRSKTRGMGNSLYPLRYGSGPQLQARLCLDVNMKHFGRVLHGTC